VSFSRISPDELAEALASAEPPLVVDVRRRAAFRERPLRIDSAVPLELDRDPLLVPDVARSRPVVAYCLCHGEASSSRVAHWLLREGYRDVAVLAGGLGAWTARALPLAPLDLARDAAAVRWMEVRLGSGAANVLEELTPDSAFLPRLAGQNFLSGRQLPLQREMASLFVDMVDSTSLVLRSSPEAVLQVVQAFMEVVVDVGVYHCGDVHDFQGDGALLYFEGVGEAVPAAFRLRDALLERRRAMPALPLARLSLDVGPVVIGIVGTRFRQAVALVGSSVHTAAKILKLAPPGGIVATASVLEQARVTSPELAREFRLLDVPGSGAASESLPGLLWIAFDSARG
jgi:class 3 adenylate cyclase/rhodanese-related sulfurtransferase